MFTEKYYENEDFREAEILESSLTGMTFINCSFQGADLAAIELKSCRFDRCSFAGAKCNGMVAKNTAFLNCKFPLATLFAATFDDCKMTGSNLADAD